MTDTLRATAASSVDGTATETTGEPVVPWPSTTSVPQADPPEDTRSIGHAFGAASTTVKDARQHPFASATLGEE